MEYATQQSELELSDTERAARKDLVDLCRMIVERADSKVPGFVDGVEFPDDKEEPEETYEPEWAADLERRWNERQAGRD